MTSPEVTKKGPSVAEVKTARIDAALNDLRSAIHCFYLPVFGEPTYEEEREILALAESPDVLEAMQHIHAAQSALMKARQQ